MITVTGATGHIGNVLVRELVARGNGVRALVMPGDNLRSLDGLNVDIVYGNLTDSHSLIAAFEGTEIVYHLGGIVSIMPGMAEHMEKVNVGGMRNVIAACRTAGVRRLVYTSSIHAIAEPPSGTVIDEAYPFDPNQVLGDYARSKARATLLLLEEVQKGGLDAVICAPTGVIGPYDFGISNIGQMIIDFASGHLKSFVEGAYDFVDVRDVAHGLVLAAEHGEAGRHYIFSGDRVQVPELMTALAEATGRPAPTYRIPAVIARTAGILASVYYRIIRRTPVFTAYSIDVLKSNSLVSSRRAREELGFATRPWREAIHDQVKWLRDEGMLPERQRRNKHESNPLPG